MIKVIAIITMFIDHFAICRVPENTHLYVILRMIGRLSMPLFSYGIAKGCFYSLNNNSYLKYLRNVTLLAVISQIPYSLIEKHVLFDFELNICFSYILSIFFIIYILENKICKNKYKKILFLLIFLLVSCFVYFITKVSYGITGIILPIIFYIFYKKSFTDKDKDTSPLIIFAIIGLLIIYYFEGNDLITTIWQSCMLLSISIISHFKNINIKIPKIIGYLCFPISMLIFYPFIF